MADLFSSQQASQQELAPGLSLFKGLACGSVLMPLIQEIIQQAPLRHMMTPMGYATKVAMSNCGPYGWVSDQHGYRYSAIDPQSRKPWPAMPEAFLTLATEAAHKAGIIEPFSPDACLINRYDVGMSLGRHQDKDEADFNWPIVSVSLGLSATFQASQKRTGKTHDILLEDGDVLVLHGPARLYYHGIKSVKADPLHARVQHRFNLTLRKAK